VFGKSDAEVLGVRPALEHSNVTLLTNAHAVRLTTNPAGTSVTEVVVEHERHLERYAADLVVVACGAVNSARLLLASATDRHPAGLANGSDEVGRNYLHPVRHHLLALSREPHATVFPRTLAVSDFYFGAGGQGADYPLGMIQLGGAASPESLRGETQVEAQLAARRTPQDVAQHAITFLLATEDIPRSDNRVTLDGDGRVRLRHTPSNLTPARHLADRVRALLPDLGMEPDHLIPLTAHGRVPPADVSYQAGTCRFGKDPSSSVLDTDCRAHELDNLYVVDTSFLPSTGAVDPALTVMANALRVGDHLLSRLGATSAALAAPAAPVAPTAPAAAEPGPTR
jgi:choline dehydrogenase-like flavoprotein